MILCNCLNIPIDTHLNGLKLVLSAAIGGAYTTEKRSSKCSTFSLLSHEDSNFDKQNQNLLCYHYTIGQSLCAFF